MASTASSLRFSPTATARLVLGLALATCFLLTMPTGLGEADSGEFALIAVLGGIAHPPGYPVYGSCLRLVGSLASSAGIPVFPALAMLSLLFSLAAAGFLHDALARVTRMPWLAAGATFAVLVTGPALKDATAVEPFALNALNASVTLWLGARALCAGRTSRRSLLATGAAYGLGFANHHTLALLAPFTMTCLVLAPPRAWRHAWAGVAGFALACLPAMLVFFSKEAAGSAATWGDWGDAWARLPVHLLRREYGTFKLVGSAHEGKMHANAVFWGGSLFYFSYVLVIPLILGFVSTLRHVTRGKSAWRVEERFAVGCALSLAAVFCLFFPAANMPASALGTSLLERFFALPLLLMAPFLARGLFVLRQGMPGPFPALLGVSLAGHAFVQASAYSHGKESYLEDHVRNVMASTEGKSLLLVSTDVEFFGLRYLQAIGAAPGDRIVFNEQLWRLPWYRAGLEKQFPGETPPMDAGIGAFVTWLEAKGYAIYTMGVRHKGLDELFDRHYHPVGNLLRYAHPSRGQPPLEELFQSNLRLAKEKHVLPERVDGHAADGILYLSRYARLWDALGTTLGQTGLSDKAGLAKEMARYLTPPPAPTWLPTFAWGADRDPEGEPTRGPEPAE